MFEKFFQKMFGKFYFLGGNDVRGFLIVGLGRILGGFSKDMRKFSSRGFVKIFDS